MNAAKRVWSVCLSQHGGRQPAMQKTKRYLQIVRVLSWAHCTLCSMYLLSAFVVDAAHFVHIAEMGQELASRMPVMKENGDSPNPDWNW